MISWIFYSFFFYEAIALHFLEHIEDVSCFTCKFALSWFSSANCFVFYTSKFNAFEGEIAMLCK